MKTPLIDVDVPITFRDHPGTLSAVFYVDIRKCNLNCYMCHNKSNKPESITYLSETMLKDKLQFLKDMGVELIIISGGEPSLYMEILLKTIMIMKQEFGFPVRIDTNGLIPQFIERYGTFVDGFAIDIKIPCDKCKQYYSKILYSSENQSNNWWFLIRTYQTNIYKSLSLISELNLPYSLTRTVKYPFLTNDDILSINQCIANFKLQHIWLDFENIGKE